MDKNHRRQLRFFKFFKPPVSLFVRWKYHFFTERIPFLKEPLLIISNHNTNPDPVFLGCSFTNHVYYVAGEHVLRMGLASKFIKYLFDPIIKHKGFNDPACIMRIMKTLKKGYNVCLFAEGNTSFNGETCEIHPTTAKLIRSCSALGATLVTYKFSGGYFSSPRWSDSFRKGSITGSLVNTYDPDKIKQMTDDEINSVLAIDLYEDAYYTQEEKQIRYVGTKLAQRLETALYICPKCNKISTLKSDKDMFFCECGLTAVYDEYGMLVGKNLPFNTVLEWDKWQEEQLKGLIFTPSNTPIFSDENISLYKINFNHEETLITKGKLILFSDRIVIGEWEKPITSISEIAIHGREKLVFSSGKDYFELKSQDIFCARKYYSIFKYLKKGI